MRPAQMDNLTATQGLAINYFVHFFFLFHFTLRRRIFITAYVCVYVDFLLFTISEIKKFPNSVGHKKNTYS